jgi:glutamyl-tRNA synthetase
MTDAPHRTRLAPSPTGALHLGNARTFLVNWLLARQKGWRIVLRIEDIDGPRIKRGADRLAIDDLRWLGIDWDEGPVYQSQRAALYDGAIHRLLDQRDAYYCACTRREAQLAASAPHAEDGSAPYPGTCRGRFKTIDDARAALDGREPTVRFRVPDETVEFDDAFAGRVRHDVEKQLGDFVIRKADGTPAYQIAVVVDDADQRVTEVVRGDDLLDSTPRQILLYRALGMSDRIPRYTHLPLVVGPDGKRLAKRHGDTRLSAYRERGVPAERVLALLARWCGVADAEPRDQSSSRHLLERFSLHNLPRGKITMTPADDAWLRRNARP